MKWRCTWCGKPHEENDPPCDSCGHGEFEEAVVRQNEFETVDTGTQYMWVCENCGRQHMRNNPPCSRCGGHDLEKTEQRFDDLESDLAVPSWFEVAKPYAPIIVVLVLVAGLFATGIVPLSVLPGIGTPSPPDAPGDGEQHAGIDLTAVEHEVHDRLEAHRQGTDANTRSYDGGLAGIAEYVNRQEVVEYREGTRPEDPDWNAFGPSCSGDPVGSALEPFDGAGSDAFDDETLLADEVADRLVANPELERLVSGEYGAEGLDVHVHDGTVFVFYAVC
ncbi:hypothetical protein OB955_00915 [Halobacteria archaeon AArc-m2/3/4]|uniref:Uncharacterized protein n=1 Tax=Natronoglomus mannanivorans TaxID=2979990 RepID=A0AAP2Z0D9_9EURY|nr:hypothetical protein [Halobacteria archaeon AArc-xg1-1]MCU4971300.1 hypothetical protein [Halobacteria archaeon AArc-m2/3/4]